MNRKIKAALLYFLFGTGMLVCLNEVVFALLAIVIKACLLIIGCILIGAGVESISQWRKTNKHNADID